MFLQIAAAYGQSEEENLDEDSEETLIPQSRSKAYGQRTNAAVGPNRHA
jgi:hypothetical protein